MKSDIYVMCQFLFWFLVRCLLFLVISLKFDVKLVLIICNICVEWYALNNYEKCFFSSKKIFSFLRYFHLPLFFFCVVHCFRGWLKVNLKVYDVIHCLNKEVMTQFVLHLERKKGMRRNIFLKNHAENRYQKLVPDPFLILINNPKQLLYTKNSFQNEIFWIRIIRKPWSS